MDRRVRGSYDCTGLIKLECTSRHELVSVVAVVFIVCVEYEETSSRWTG